MTDRTTIWKYPIWANPATFDTLYIPGFQRFLSVGIQDEKPVVWAIVDPDEDKVAIRLWVTPTGGPALPDAESHGFPELRRGFRLTNRYL